MPARVGVNLRASAYLHQGDRKYMEDEFVAAYQRTPDKKDIEYAFFGIFDGHGGKEAANFAKDNLMDNIVSQRIFWSDDDDDILDAIKQGFIQTHLAMLKVVDTWPRTASGWPSTSGSTASVAFIRRQKIYIGHVGDSGIVMGEKTPDRQEWSGWQMTSDHKPEDSHEKERIGNAGGRVVNKGGVPRVVWQRPRRGHNGPVRRSTPMEEIPFLAVARSLGDLWSYNSSTNQFVVSPVPDVHYHSIDLDKHKCLILGTDGLWNVMSPFVSSNIAQSSEYNNEMHALGHSDDSTGEPYLWVNPSRSVVKGALERYSRCGVRADNTSAVVVYLDPPGRPKRELLQERRAAESSSPKREPLDDVTKDPTLSEVKVNVYHSTPSPAPPSSPSAYSMLRIKERIADDSWRDHDDKAPVASPAVKAKPTTTQAPTPGTMAALHGEDANPVAMEANLRRQALLGRSSSSNFSSPNSAFASPSLRSATSSRLSIAALPGTPAPAKREREGESSTTSIKKKKTEATSSVDACTSIGSQDIQSPVVTSSSTDIRTPKRPRDKRATDVLSVSPKKATRHHSVRVVEPSHDASSVQSSDSTKLLATDSSIKSNNNNSSVKSKLPISTSNTLAMKKSLLGVANRELKTVSREKTVKRLGGRDACTKRVQSHAKLSIANKLKKKAGVGVPLKKVVLDTSFVNDSGVKMHLRSDKSMQTRSTERKKKK